VLYAVGQVSGPPCSSLSQVETNETYHVLYSTRNDTCSLTLLIIKNVLACPDTLLSFRMNNINKENTKELDNSYDKIKENETEIPTTVLLKAQAS